MLKSKDAYANESAYARAFFLHNSEVADYPIDPIVGSFVRVIYPREDQPKTDKGWYNRPQFIFISKAGHSRMYELTDAKALYNVLSEMVKSPILNEMLILGTPIVKNILSLGNGEICFRAVDGGQARLITIPVVLAERRFPGQEKSSARFTELLSNLASAFKSIVDGTRPVSDIVTIGNDSMMAIHRPIEGVRSPLILTVRQPSNVPANYLVIGSGKDRLCFQHSKNISVLDTIDEFFGTVALTAQDALSNGVDAFRFIREPDVNMEYVSARHVDFDSGRRLRIIMNSDRFPANAKLAYIYEPDTHFRMHDKIRAFAKVIVENFKG
ncbi:hypothetical protein D5W64_12275 [Salmonella enterica subsp. enterica serovar Saintpaul]|nr:hypothetical protein [Salmonella enterica subsp. enterica serovar Saintpaul]